MSQYLQCAVNLAGQGVAYEMSESSGKSVFRSLNNRGGGIKIN